MNYNTFKTGLKLGLLTILGYAAACSTQKQIPVRYHERIWLTPEVIEETGLAQVIPQNDLEKSLVADIDVFPQGGAITTVMSLPTSGFEVNSTDYEGRGRNPDGYIDQASLCSWDARHQPWLTRIRRRSLVASYEHDAELEEVGQTVHEFILAQARKNKER